MESTQQKAASPNAIRGRKRSLIVSIAIVGSILVMASEVAKTFG
jgi:uncharacterized membrane protein